MKQSEFNEHYKLHVKWLSRDPDGRRMVLNNEKMSKLNMSGLDLREADLSFSDLSCSDLSHSNLSKSDLRFSDLSHSNLSCSDLSKSNLRFSDLSKSNLSKSNLISADLSHSNLRFSDLSCSDLRFSYLYNTTGDGKYIKSVHDFDEYRIIYTDDTLQIGCKSYSIDDWLSFTDREILEMDGKKALEFWRRNRNLIKKIIETNPALPTNEE